MANPDPKTTKAFADGEAFERWLTTNHRKAPVLWLRFYKKHTGTPTISKDEAIDIALCWGWIDGQLGKGDDKSWLVRFTPRGPKSMWSKINRERVARLMRKKRMQPPGLAQVEAAKADGRWDAAYDGQSGMTPPKDLLKAIAANKAAQKMYKALNRQNQFALYYRVTSAKKTETREKRIAQFVDMLARGETIYPNGGKS